MEEHNEKKKTGDLLRKRDSIVLFVDAKLAKMNARIMMVCVGNIAMTS